MATNSPQVAGLLKQDYAEVKQRPSGELEYRGRRDESERAYEQVGLADNDLLQLFDFTWIAGDPATALEAPAAAVLTESMARKYFGDAEPMGQSFIIGNGLVVTVSGIIEDLPATTHLRFDLLASMSLATSAFAQNALQNWSAQEYHTYVEFAEGADIEEFAAQLPDFIERHAGEGASEVVAFNVLPVADIHLYSATRNEMRPPGSISMVYAFIAIAVVILLIACINFMNLATARSNRRAREIGVRKTVGASRWQLIGQFLGESALLTTIAMLVAITLVEVTRPVFNVLVRQRAHHGILEQFMDLAVHHCPDSAGQPAGRFVARVPSSAFRPVTCCAATAMVRRARHRGSAAHSSCCNSPLPWCC